MDESEGRWKPPPSALHQSTGPATSASSTSTSQPRYTLQQSPKFSRFSHGCRDQLRSRCTKTLPSLDESSLKIRGPQKQHHEMEKPYLYSELVNPSDIRVLELQPASDDSAPLQCRLQVVPLTEAAGTYEGLSYCVGDLVPSIPLDVDNAGTLLITSNLASALRAFRQRDATRSIWVDAVCIYPDRHRIKRCRYLRV